MKVTLQGNPSQTKMCDLQEGDIAVILPNEYQKNYVGRIVVILNDDRAWTLGGKLGQCFTVISCNDLPVRVLTAGEVIELRED